MGTPSLCTALTCSLSFRNSGKNEKTVNRNSLKHLGDKRKPLLSPLAGLYSCSQHLQSLLRAHTDSSTTGSCSEPLALCTAVAAEEKEKTCLQRVMQPCDQHRIVFFHPPKMQDRQATDTCQEEEPHKTMRKEERQQQRKQGCGGDGISAQVPVPCLFQIHCSEDFPARQCVVLGQETLVAKPDLLSFLFGYECNWLE